MSTKKLNERINVEEEVEMEEEEKQELGGRGGRK